VNINGGRCNGTIIAGVTRPLYDGGARSAALTEARTDADNADAKLRHVREDAVYQIVLADNALHAGLSAYAASGALVSVAQTTFDTALTAYRSDVGSITDLTIALGQLLQASNASSDAYITALSAAAIIALSTGALGQAPP